MIPPIVGELVCRAAYPVGLVALTNEALSALVFFGILAVAVATAAYAVRMVRRS